MAEIVYIAIRRDHAGNLDVLRLEDRKTPAWNLTEARAKEIVAWIQRDHTKVHGQTYWEEPYEKGTLWAYLEKRGIRV